jgi:NAD(P)-dependent dehydrogenase (short-subunit alcohol dehydrogenase family)
VVADLPAAAGLLEQHAGQSRMARRGRGIQSTASSSRKVVMSTQDQQQQKVAVITGASQGIGAGLVAGYRRLGYAVVATSRTIGESQDPEVLVVRGDLADPATAELVVAAGVERFGRIDTLVNNAGVFIAKPFTEYTREEYEAMVGVNLTGFFRLTQLAISHMLPQGGGHIVQISTSLVDHADSSVNSALASLTKGGLHSVTKALAIEYATRGIRVNAISLGIIKTTMHSAEHYDALATLHPVGRLGEVGDVVDAAVYLEGAPFVTGEILHVDGGQSAGR